MRKCRYRLGVVFKTELIWALEENKISVFLCVYVNKTMDCFGKCVNIVYLFRHKGIKDIETLR
jgi:hypothetical protein